MTTTRLLAVVLLVQGLLALVTWWPSGPAGLQPLVGLERDAIEEIEVLVRPEEGGDADPVVLARDGESWVIRSAADYPAQPARVDELLDAVVSLRAGAPVATQATSHAAFEIGDDGYGRRLTVRGAGEEESSWLLSPATSRSVYARAPGSDDVYRAQGASEWAFRDEASSYWDASYVSDDASRFEAVAVRNPNGSLRFEQRDGDWTLSDLTEGEQADAAAIASFVEEIASLRMREPVGREVLPEHGLEAGARVDWTIPSEDQSVAGGYTVGADVESDAYVKAVGQPFVVRVGQSQVESLREATREGFLVSADSGTE